MVSPGQSIRDEVTSVERGRQLGTKTESDGFAVFFCAISSLRATTRGSFATDTAQGLMTINVSVGPAKLVPASNYPGVNYFRDDGSDL